MRGSPRTSLQSWALASASVLQLALRHTATVTTPLGIGISPAIRLDDEHPMSVQESLEQP
jgi:hypothetical protein